MTIVKEFACIAEAAAHYVEQGYTTVDYGDRSRIMRRGRDEVIINKEGLLHVVAEEALGACHSVSCGRLTF